MKHTFMKENSKREFKSSRPLNSDFRSPRFNRNAKAEIKKAEQAKGKI